THGGGHHQASSYVHAIEERQRLKADVRRGGCISGGVHRRRRSDPARGRYEPQRAHSLARADISSTTTSGMARSRTRGTDVRRMSWSESLLASPVLTG